MDLANTLTRTPPSVLVGGNLDPAEVFVGGTPADVAAKTESLLASAAGHPNFFISSGCDIPYSVPMENLTSFFDTVARCG
jgi:uroporphyrinogen decarboxylase